MASTYEGGVTRSINETSASNQIFWNSINRNLDNQLRSDLTDIERNTEALLGLTKTGVALKQRFDENHKKKLIREAASNKWRSGVEEKGTSLYHTEIKRNEELYGKSSQAFMRLVRNEGLVRDRARIALIDDPVKRDLEISQYLEKLSNVALPAFLAQNFKDNNLPLKLKDGTSFAINGKLNREQRSAATEWLTDRFLSEYGVYNLNQTSGFLDPFYENVGKVEAKSVASYMKFYNTQQQFEDEEDAWNVILGAVKKNEKPNWDPLVNILAAGTKTPGGKNLRSFGDVQQEIWDRAKALSKVDPKLAKQLQKAFAEGSYTDTEGEPRKFSKTAVLEFDEQVNKDWSEQEDDEANRKKAEEGLLAGEHEAEVNKILADDSLTSREQANAIDALTPIYQEKWDKLGLGTGTPGFLGDSFHQRKNTYATDKSQLAVFAKKQGGILFEYQVENRNPKLVNELRGAGKIKPSLEDYVTGREKYKNADKIVGDAVGTLFGRTGWGGFKNSDGRSFHEAAMDEVLSRVLLEGTLLGDDPDLAIQNARESVLKEIKEFKNKEEAKGSYLWKATQGSDVQSGALKDLSRLFKGDWKDMDFSKPLPESAYDQLSSLRNLPETETRELLYTASGKLATGSPMTRGIYNMYVNSITLGESKAFEMLDQDELMLKLINVAKVTPVEIKPSKNQKRRRDILDACGKDKVLRRNLSTSLWNLRRSKQAADKENFLKLCRIIRPALFQGGS